MTARVELEKLYEENKEMELQSRKAKTRAEHDVEAVISSFDEEMTTREQEYQEALKVYNELQRQIEVHIPPDSTCCHCHMFSLHVRNYGKRIDVLPKKIKAISPHRATSWQ